MGRVPDNAFYFNGLIDVSGNIAGLIKKNVIKDGDTARLFGAPFSQYAKMEIDFRYYRKLDDDNVWANRIILGAGIPYGNSRELPFIKQFFVGAITVYVHSGAVRLVPELTARRGSTRKDHLFRIKPAM